jgi:hypothetical protein|tara:strand:- start:75 stop:299 length:225 start_codon:yes stop_codon:yes gene_type:complete
MKYLVNFKIKEQGWSEIVDVLSNKDSQDDKLVAREKAAEMLKNRILNDGVFSLIDKSNTNVIPMELEKLEKESK